jgi:hypothetical protein
MFSILYPVRIRATSDPVEKLMNWEQFHSLAYELVFPDIQICPSNEADKAGRDFAASIALAYRPLTRKITKLDQKYEMPCLDYLLEHKRKLRKVMMKSRDPKCKMAVNWVTQNISRRQHLKDGKQCYTVTKKLQEQIFSVRYGPRAYHSTHEVQAGARELELWNVEAEESTVLSDITR